MMFVSINLIMTGMHGVELVWMLYSCVFKIYWLLVLVSGLRDTPFWRKIDEDRSSTSFATGEVKLLQRHIQPILSKAKVRSLNFLFLSNYTWFRVWHTVLQLWPGEFQLLVTRCTNSFPRRQETKTVMDIRIACSILTRHFLKAEMKACEYWTKLFFVFPNFHMYPVCFYQSGCRLDHN